MKIFTIGFTKKSLEDFVKLLKDNNIDKVVDIRLKNDSQLAGWAKGRDIKFILENFLNVEYEHLPEFAPTEELLKRFREDQDWERYEIEFKDILKNRDLVSYYKVLVGGDKNVCLLCSEPTTEKCHRRLVAEHLQERQDGLEIVNI